MSKDFNLKQFYNFNDLVEIMKILRCDCPWDKEQTHESILINFIEETYEAVDAIKTDDPELLREELGDVLLQVLFHSEIESQAGRFSIDDVVDEVCKKLIIRHPHIFSDGISDRQADTSEQVLKNWDAIKQETKNQNTYTETLETIPKSLPALMRAQKLQKRAKKCGFDFKNLQEAIDKLYEEIIELNKAIKTGYKQDMEEEVGDILFSAVNISRMLSVDSELALGASCDKFFKWFALMEKNAIESGKRLEDMTLEEMDAIWNKIKNNCK